MIAGALAELRVKYEEMLALRLIASRGRDASSVDGSAEGGTYDPRARMVALAARFPGSLREIDELPITEIEARIDALSRAERDPNATARWMHAMTRFHTLTRGILFAKRARRERRLARRGARLARRSARREAADRPLDGSRLRAPRG